jgi:hypothetical protein
VFPNTFPIITPPFLFIPCFSLKVQLWCRYIWVVRGLGGGPKGIMNDKAHFYLFWGGKHI